MSLYLYNTLPAQKQLFTPLVENHIGIYVCGPTVYDLSHIGHARAYVAFDTIVRFLRRFYTVTFVRNYTDIDDKIIKRANELGKSAEEISEHYIEAFRQDMQMLHVLPADVEPKVTEHVPEIIALINELIQQGVAYLSGGDVYYAVERFATYGKLSKRSLEDMQAGARVEISEQKRNPLDFVLWKAAKPNEPYWDSPFGKGRPGWHIECSAMSAKYLGASFDIHGGGKDLIFPHHENEIAQSEAAQHKPYVRYWLHNGFVNIDNEKMSKSLGNFFTIRDVCQKFDPLTLRFYLLTTHYRSPIQFSDAALQEAEARLHYLYSTLQRLTQAVQNLGDKGLTSGEYRQDFVATIDERFVQAMQDDFNTPKVLADVSEIFKLTNEILAQPNDSETDSRTLRALHKEILKMGEVLGLFTELQPQEVLERLAVKQQTALGVNPQEVERLIALRNEARKAKNFAESDRIRDQLLAMHVVLKDGPAGTLWEVKI